MLIDPQAAAKRLGDLPPATLSQWRHRGVGPRYAKIGKHVRYDEDELDAWVETQKRGGEHPAA